MNSKSTDAGRTTPPAALDRESKWGNASWRWHWRSPFVLPGSSLQRMTGIVRFGTHVAFAHGRQDGDRFHVEESASYSGPDALDRVAQRCRALDAPVCVAVPRGMLLDRHYRLPSKEEPEVDSMLEHLLANDLPSSIDAFAWTWSRVSQDPELMQLVKVYIARNDHLDAFVEPFTHAGLPVVDLVPTSWAWARAIERVGGPGPEGDEPVSRSFVVPREGAAYLLVTRGRDLLFDAPLSKGPDGESPDVETTKGAEDSGEWKELDASYRDLFGAPLPSPRVVPPGSDESADGERVQLASAVAAIGLERHRCLLPPRRVEAQRRRLWVTGLADVFQIVLALLLVALAVFLYEDGRARGRLDAIERELAGQADRVAELRQQSEAIRGFEARGPGEGKILHVIESLRRDVRPQIHLDHLDVTEAGLVTLRGGATETGSVLEMAEVLSDDPTWNALRVVQLRSEVDGGPHPLQFVLEGRVGPGGTP